MGPIFKILYYYFSVLTILHISQGQYAKAVWYNVTEKTQWAVPMMLFVWNYEDPIFCGGRDHRLTSDILNIKLDFCHLFPNLCNFAFSMCNATLQK